MQRKRLARIVGVALSGAVALPLGVSGAALAGEPDQGDPWALIDKRSSTKSTDGIDFGARDDGWAVGMSYESGKQAPYAVHWDGKTWSEVDVGNLADKPTSLSQVVTLDSGEAWASGAPVPASRKRSPRPGSELPVRDASGGYADGTVSGAQAAQSSPYVLAHWDGKKWAPAKTPKPPEGKRARVVELDTVGEQIWAVGLEIDNANVPTQQQAFIDRYSGGKWQRLELPKELTSQPSTLLSVTGTDPNDVWLSGALPTPKKDTPFVAHWDGKRFTVSKLPVPEGFPNGWNADEVATMGGEVYVTGRSLYTNRTLATGYRFDGKKWTEWKDRALAEVNDISVAPDGGSMVLGGWPSLSSHYSEYAVFDGKAWTKHAQPADLGKHEGQVLGVDHLPDTDRVMAVGYINADDGGYSYITANKK